MYFDLFVCVLFVLLALIATIAMQGCSGGGGSLGEIQGAGSGTTLEWDDLDAAVKYVADKNELGIVDRMTVTMPDSAGAERVIRRYVLVDVLDHPVEIRFSTDPGALAGLQGASQSRAGSVVVRVGRFGDDQREAALVEALLKRLDALVMID